MKKLLLSTVALASLTAGAMAADLPARRVAPAPFAAVPVFTWTGFYVGANIGVGWNDNNRNGFGNFFDNGLIATSAAGAVAPVVPLTGSFGFGNGFGGGNNNNTGILGGVQAGFNWQMTPGSGFVVGVEADIQAVGNRNRNNNNFLLNNGGFGVAVAFPPVIPVPTAANPANVAFFNNGALNFNGRGGSDWFGTARVRVGYAFDRFLVYATGGLAFTDDRNRNNGVFGGGFGAIPAAFFVPGTVLAPGLLAANGLVFGGNNNNNVGWALGFGGEWAFTNNISAKLEYLHLGFDRNNNNAFLGNAIVGVTSSGAAITQTNAFGFGNGRRNNRGDIDLVRVGINFRFGT